MRTEFEYENLKRGNHYVDRGLDVKLMLNMTFQKCVISVWTGWGQIPGSWVP